MLHSMVEWTDLGAAAETSVRPGSALAKLRQFGCEAGGLGVQRFQSSWDLLIYLEINQ